MDHRIRFKAFLCICVTIVVARPLTAPTVKAQAPSRRLIVQTDRASLRDRLKAFGYRKRGGIPKSKTDSNDDRFRSLPHFSSSFTVGGVTYPYTMVGHPPRSGHVSNIKSVIVPLRMRFVGFGPNQDFAIDFDPKVAVQNILDS